jgi:ceramide glucosyltransferase
MPPAIEAEVPFVTILRPAKGYDPNLALCLASTCLIDYPHSKFELVFCVASPQDAAIPVINLVMEQHPGVKMKLLVGEEDVGPNPKIRNMSRGYREAKGDIVWILDCNIWVPPGILRRSVQQMEGANGALGFKLVHHLPVAVDVSYPQLDDHSSPRSPINGLLDPLLGGNTRTGQMNFFSKIWSCGGGRLEESFLSSSHAKFYCAINTIGIAPCIVGKSNLFRRSHLEEATKEGEPQRRGILYFAENICEDHLLAEKLWLTPLEEELSGDRKWGKHGMGCDLVIQPIEDMSVGDYLTRRTRWIRVRKYSVLSATLAEPNTESIVASLIGAYGFTTVTFFSNWIGASWSSFLGVWIVSMLSWALSDRLLFNFLHGFNSVAVDDNSPKFIAKRRGRGLGEWFLQWFGREFFAFGVWAWALWPGEVNWRGGRYRVKWKDMKVEEIGRDDGKRQD